MVEVKHAILGRAADGTLLEAVRAYRERQRDLEELVDELNGQLLACKTRCNVLKRELDAVAADRARLRGLIEDGT